jgi:DNA/RNA endonuclease YhcR with UshA esterase domain
MKIFARAALAVSAVMFVAKPALADVVAAAKAKWHVGETVTVEGVVSEVHTSRFGGTTFICIGDAYSNDAFTAVVFAHRSAAVGDLSGLAGKTVDIVGMIQNYEGAPEIIISARDQIRVRRNQVSAR